MNMEELMQEQTDKLISLLAEDVIDVKNFYNISITPTRIRCQGDAKLNTILKYKDAGWKFFLDDCSTMMSGDKDGVFIILTF